MDNTVGEKIRRFRKRAGVSQFELELRINASPGSISRIESGQVNPTKETLQKVIEVLELKVFEAGSLFNLNFDEFPKMVNLAKKLSSSLDLEEVLQYAVNEITNELGLLGSVLLLCEGDYVYAQAMSQNPFTKITQEMLPVPLKRLRASLIHDTDNYVVKCVKEKSPQYSTVFNNFCKGVIPIKLADFIQNMNGTKCTLCFPILFNSEAIGAILFSKEIVDKFESEINVLKVFAEHVGIAIMNAKRYEVLQAEVNVLKYGNK